jgi:recombination protein RecA
MSAATKDPPVATEPTKETAKEVKEVKKAATATQQGMSRKASNVADITRAYILKKYGQKPIDTAPSTMPHIPSGSIVVDNLIGGSRSQDGKGQVCPGYPRRYFTEIYGPESSGKTTLALAAVAQVQRAGGTVMYLDFEYALHHGYAKQIGVKFDRSLSVYRPETLEDGFNLMSVAIQTGIDLVVVDSVAAMVPAAELNKPFEDAARVGAVAKKMAENIPKFAMWLRKFPVIGKGENKKHDPTRPGTAIILLNQERASITTGGGGGHGPETNTSGGKALKYYFYIRLRLTRYSLESVERVDRLTGKKKKFQYAAITNVKCIKNKADAKMGHSANIFVRYGYGVDDVHSIIESGVATGILERNGSYYSYNGERLGASRDKFRSYLLANAKVLEEIRGKVVQAIIESAQSAVADDELEDDDDFIQTLGEMDEDGEDEDKPEKVVLGEDDVGDAELPDGVEAKEVE